MTVFGKGGTTRAVLLPASVWQDLVAPRGEAGADEPVIRSRKGGTLDPSQVLRIVRAAAARAGLAAKGSPHWLRHGHASIATTGTDAHARPTDSSARYLAI